MTPICIVAIGNEHVNEAIKLIDDFVYIGHLVYFYVLTDSPEQFRRFDDRAIVYYHKPERFNFHCKMRILQNALKHSDNFNRAILMDVDMAMRDKAYPKLHDLEVGIHPQLVWKYPADCSFENFIAGKVDRVPYGKEYAEFCAAEGIKIDGAQLIQESMVYFKFNSDKQKNVFFDTWSKLADFCTRKDMERDQHVLGFGEGYSIGAAAVNAGVTVHDPGSTQFSEFYKHIKHFIWET